ncbi:hypothetical protein F0562_028420 [Nyssa sinensis]|uniref:DUF241 domain-containing protein n=1 Tax=Nyssa sinensis TaxID=561372 RepID=A0A5J5B246_9ASTE|nr:hypothetical protein F0562_028420 [Nyssa sinensis]
MKESVQELQSVLRRRRGDEFGVSYEVGKYLTQRKKVKNAVQKALRNLDGSVNKNHETAVMVGRLREVETVTFTVLESLTSFIIGEKAQSKPSSWSLVSKLMNPKRVSCEATSEINEFWKLDAALQKLVGHKTSKSVSMQVENAQKELGKLELNIQDLEEGLEFLFKHLIKARVVRASEATSSSLSSISKGLSGLEDLYDCLDDLLLLPHVQQALSHERHQKWVDEVLDGYLRLLDVCSSAKDVFSQTKQDVQDLLSVLRRRRDANDFNGYLSSRKKAKKAIQKSLKDLKSIKNKRTLVAMDKDHETMAILSMLNEVEAVTLAVFDSLLSNAMGTRMQSGWSLVSKLIHHKSVADEETDMNEFEKVDAILHSVIGHKSCKSENNRNIEQVQNQLGILESGIQDLEGGLEVRASEETSSSLSSISNGLSGLEDLYDCVDDLLLLPHAQQAFAHLRHQKWVDEALDGYLRLLDVCSSAKEVFSQTKQDVQDLLSILRRRRDADDFGGYLASRKKVIQKSLKDIKSVKNKHTLLAMDKDHETVTHISMLNEVEETTLALLESLLCYVAGTKKVQSKRSTLSLVSKLMHHKSVAWQPKETDANEFYKVDAALHSFIGHKTNKSDNIIHVENVQNQLGKLQLTIQDLEEGLESLFRRLIKTRVSLLNIVNH